MTSQFGAFRNFGAVEQRPFPSVKFRTKQLLTKVISPVANRVLQAVSHDKHALEATRR